MLSQGHLRSSLLLALASLLLGGAAASQGTPGGAAPAQGRPSLIPPGAPVAHFVYDVGTGEARPVTDPVTVGGTQAQTTICFDNDNTFGFTSLSNNPGEEFVDWGIKTCGGTNVVESFQIGYLSFNLDPGQGGPGASFSAALYSGTTGFGVLGQEMRRLSMSGLPTLNGALIILTVDLRSDPVCLPDGPIGWGFRNDDGDTAVLLGIAPNYALGIIDALDVYSGPATAGGYTGTYNFGKGNPYGTLYFRIAENDGAVLAGSTVVNGTGTNPLAFQEVSPAVIGQTWVTSVDLSTIPVVAATVVIISAAAIPPAATPFGELLIDLGVPSQTSIALGRHFISVPKNLQLAGVTVHTQAALVRQLVLPVGFQLTNGLDVTLGY